MARKKFILRHVVVDSERWRVALLAQWGYTYRTIAARVYGKGTDYNPSDAEVARVGKIAREEGVSSMDWRRGSSMFAKSVLRRLETTQLVGPVKNKKLLTLIK